MCVPSYRQSNSYCTMTLKAVLTFCLSFIKKEKKIIVIVPQQVTVKVHSTTLSFVRQLGVKVLIGLSRRRYFIDK